MTNTNKLLHPLWRKSSLRYEYEDGKILTITYGSVKQLKAILTDSKDSEAYDLVLQTMNMSDSKFGQLSKFGGFSLNNYRSGRMIVSEEYYDENNTTMGAFKWDNSS